MLNYGCNVEDLVVNSKFQCDAKPPTIKRSVHPLDVIVGKKTTMFVHNLYIVKRLRPMH
jgi:hypothetical protein